MQVSLANQITLQLGEPLIVIVGRISYVRRFASDSPSAPLDPADAGQGHEMNGTQPCFLVESRQSGVAQTQLCPDFCADLFARSLGGSIVDIVGVTSLRSQHTSYFEWSSFLQSQYNLPSMQQSNVYSDAPRHCSLPLMPITRVHLPCWTTNGVPSSYCPATKFSLVVAVSKNLSSIFTPCASASGGPFWTFGHQVWLQLLRTSKLPPRNRLLPAVPLSRSKICLLVGLVVSTKSETLLTSFFLQIDRRVSKSWV